MINKVITAIDISQYGQHDLYLTTQSNIVEPVVDGIYQASMRVGGIHDDYQVQITIDVVVKNDSIIEYLFLVNDTLNNIDMKPTYAHFNEMIFTEDKYGRVWDIVLSK